jgi:hypothetical protein
MYIYLLVHISTLSLSHRLYCIINCELIGVYIYIYIIFFKIFYHSTEETLRIVETLAPPNVGA